MPYQSAAQRRFMHAKHPDIAARWDEEIRAQKKKGKYVKPPERVEKRKKDWAIGLSTAAVGGALANQVPPVKLKRKKKGRVSKMLVPLHDDPYFNQAAAQKMFDLVMKMDDDTAEMFCHVVASDLLEQEVENNRVTLQKHLDEVIAKRLTMVKQATIRLVSKGMADPVPFAQTLAMVEAEIAKASKVDDDDLPNWTFERKIRRDPSSGRFQTKISNRPVGKKPIPDKTAASMGIEGTNERRYRDLSAEDKARYQHQYLQVANFLDAVNAGTEGNNRVMLHYKNDKTGETWSDLATSTKPPASNMLTAGYRVIGAEAEPTTLTAGGTAFSLAGAMGNTMSARQVETYNEAAKKTPDWTKSWLDEENTGRNKNERLYRRTQTLGQVAGALGPPGSKVQLAGAMAEIVGQYGPQAEQVIGPSARKSAYRYRGTERTPDQRLVAMYGRAIEENKKVGPINRWADQAEAERREPRGTRVPRGTGPRPAPGLHQMVAEREARANRAPEWGEREMGRAAVAQYLTEQLPSKQNYKLQLASGNTPPSEGVIINSDGQIVTQAVGYGDDHYLPFNLKNLKGLKGGEYIRNRSVGGLTAEDVYTGLISGARRVTVVSRSGTFTMEFKPDFRGGRRHNDKARRMTRRYEQILDAVQSEQVERQDVPPRWKKIIEEEVRGEYGPSASQRLVRTEIDARIKEFKANPQIDGRDLDRAEAEISRLEARQARGEVSRQDVADYRKEVMNELRNLKEIHFRLNGVGYAAALDSLREQFPYYIDSAANPKEEHLDEFEQDRGYVEPGRNRPTDAQAGWYGTAARGKSGAEGRGGKFSASLADYQRGLPGSRAPKEAEASAGPSAPAASSGGGGGAQRSERERARDKAAEALEQNRAQERVRDAAVKLQQAAQGHKPPGNMATPEWWSYNDNEMREYVSSSDNLKKFHTWVSGLGDRWNETDASQAWQEYKNTTLRVNATDYGPQHRSTWMSAPYKFPGEAHEAYRPSPERGAVEGEIRNIDGRDASLKFDQPLSALSERQLREEFELAKSVSAAMKTAGLSGDAAQDALATEFKNPGAGYVSQFFREKGAEQHLDNIHRMRHLRAKSGWGMGGGDAGGSAGSSSSGGGTGGGGGGGGSWTGTPGQPTGGRLVPVEMSEEDKAAAAGQVEEARKTWVKAAHSAQSAATEPDDINDLTNFIAGMESAKGAEGGFKAHDKWLDELRPEVRTKLEQSYGGARR